MNKLIEKKKMIQAKKRAHKIYKFNISVIIMSRIYHLSLINITNKNQT